MPGPDDILQYLTIFGMLVGSAFGLPIPEELPIVIAGAMVGKEWNVEHSGMHWWIMLPVVIFGVVLCDAALYLIGRQWGARLLSSSWFQRRLLPAEKRQKIEENFHKYGIGILMVARITPGIRTPIFLMSGMLRLPFRKFLLADALYAVPGVNVLFWLSYWFTDRFMRAYQTIEANKYLVVAVVLAAVSGFLSYSFLFRRRIATGSPEDIPVVGGKVASTLSHMSKPVPTEKIVAVEKQIAGIAAASAAGSTAHVEPPATTDGPSEPSAGATAKLPGLENTVAPDTRASARTVQPVADRPEPAKEAVAVEGLVDAKTAEPPAPLAGSVAAEPVSPEKTAPGEKTAADPPTPSAANSEPAAVPADPAIKPVTAAPIVAVDNQSNAETAEASAPQTGHVPDKPSPAEKVIAGEKKTTETSGPAPATPESTTEPGEPSVNGAQPGSAVHERSS